ncbi:DUF6597 domain-containing transcriptional factor [Streptosporangium amethystogenes]|uniref:DUF6597 domain-containing transcriptional factor n=1 Tax=Streptosporangium amethystogenes TaxID=2002 RepID=UPI0004C481CD|nr:DUF6597 domain-containing transcriptional factor [Streptosporangium amethystogenes]
MYREWAPDSRVAGRVACVWSNEATTVATTGTPQLVVPDGCVDLIWGPGGAQVAGPDTGPKTVWMSPGDRYLGIRFSPGAAGGVFGVPLDSLRDLRIPLSELEPLRELSELAPFTGGPPERATDVVQRVLAVRMRTTPEPDPAASAIAEALLAGRSVREVAWDLGLGERQLLRRSLWAFGYGPKTLQRVVRFQRALRLAKRGVAAAEVAAASGYADQAHMANEVRRLAGVPLGRLIGRSADGH